MPKITFLGAGSSVFAKNVLGDCMTRESLQNSHIALYDIDAARLDDSRRMLENLNVSINEGRAHLTAHLGVENRKEALRGADYVVNAIQVGGYKPGTETDFEVPKKYNLRQTIADTLGIGGIFRTLRTLPVMLDFARDIEEVCPEAWLLNYTNPMAMLTAGMLRGSGVKTVGLCHSVQVCARGLLESAGLWESCKDTLQWKIAGINHMGWLLEITADGKDLYPEIKERIFPELDRVRQVGPAKILEEAEQQMAEDGSMQLVEGQHNAARIAKDMVRLEVMRRFGHYVTESSEHFSEYCPWFIKHDQPGLIDEYNIPLDEYPRRCESQIQKWGDVRKRLVENESLTHELTHEYGSLIMDAMETNEPTKIGGNVLNTNLITNLPRKAAVEVPCLVDRSGIQPCHVGDLPEPLAAMNRTNINPQILTVEAVLTGKMEYVYQAAMLDPHTATELTIDQICTLCDDLYAAHGELMPKLD